MDWTSERYVRLYTRDTPEWLCLPWQSRALWPLIIRKSDRAGVIATKLGHRGIAVLCALPPEVTEVGLAGLLEDGCLKSHPLGYAIPNFIEAQEARMDGAERQRKHREARRDMINAGLLDDQRQPVVYFVQSEHGGPVKIGFADDVAKRMTQLQVSRPDKLILLASMPGTIRDESDLHRRFVHLRERGEWFTGTQELMDFIKSIACYQSQNVTVTVTSNELQLVTPYRTDPIRAEPNHAVPVIGEQAPPVSQPDSPGLANLKAVTDAAVDKAKRKRGTQLPDSWAPRPEERDRCVRAGLDCDAEVEAFRDHHKTRGNAFLDWDAAFRTWIRNGVKFAKPKQSNQTALEVALSVARGGQ